MVLGRERVDPGSGIPCEKTTREKKKNDSVMKSNFTRNRGRFKNMKTAENDRKKGSGGIAGLDG